MSFTVTTILAPPGATIPVVFVADGFKSTQLSDFDDAIDDNMAKIRTTAPFNTTANKGKFQWYKVSTVSVDQGASTINHPYNPVTAVVKNTYHKVYRNKVGLIHYYGIPDYNRRRLASGLLKAPGGFFANRPDDNVFIIIISNDSNYGGGAEFLGLKPSTSAPDRMSICIVSTGSGANMEGVAIHEFEHSFGDLDDEYVDESLDAMGNIIALPINTAYALKTYEADVWNYGNRLNIKNTNPGGWFSGARYVSSGKFRATNNDLMKDVTASSFGSPNETLLQDRIDDEA